MLVGGTDKTGATKNTHGDGDDNVQSTHEKSPVNRFYGVDIAPFAQNIRPEASLVLLVPRRFSATRSRLRCLRHVYGPACVPRSPVNLR